jgi:secreted PhoX family phosphatase
VITRRGLMRASAAFAITLPISVRGASPVSGAALRPVNDETTGLPLLKLPPGFTYRSFSWTGDPMVDGSATPGRHDGMCVSTASRPGETLLLRNHEQFFGARFGAADVPTYDSLVVATGAHEHFPDGFAGACGGVTAVVLKGGVYQESQPLLTGTLGNCAGGPTPWGSWLTCEEIVLRGTRWGAPEVGFMQDHGYVFEVPAPHLARASARPIKDLGLMKHEATAIGTDGNVYETEDNAIFASGRMMSSGFYRMLPTDRSGTIGSLEKGGELQMLKVRGKQAADLAFARQGETFDIEWVTIADPDQDPEQFTGREGGPQIVGSGRSGPFLQGQTLGAAAFARLEGCYHSEGVIYFTDTAGGANMDGTVWAYDIDQRTLKALFVSTSTDQAHEIDNVTVSKAGLIVGCEEKPGMDETGKSIVRGTRLFVIGRNGSIATIAENDVALTASPAGKSIEPADYRGSEWAGVAFSPDGETLYANVQVPGITVAIRGPWDALA